MHIGEITAFVFMEKRTPLGLLQLPCNFFVTNTNLKLATGISKTFLTTCTFHVNHITTIATPSTQTPKFF
jgi:hypothetical protein